MASAHSNEVFGLVDSLESVTLQSTIVNTPL